MIGGCTKYMHPWCICACIRIDYITSVQKWNTHIITCRTRRQFHTQTPLQMQCYKCNVTSALQNQEALCEPSESTVSTNEKEKTQHLSAGELWHGLKNVPFRADRGCKVFRFRPPLIKRTSGCRPRKPRNYVGVPTSKRYSSFCPFEMGSLGYPKPSPFLEPGGSTKTT